MKPGQNRGGVVRDHVTGQSQTWTAPQFEMGAQPHCGRGCFGGIASRGRGFRAIHLDPGALHSRGVPQGLQAAVDIAQLQPIALVDPESAVQFRGAHAVAIAKIQTLDAHLLHRLDGARPLG